MWFTFPEGVKGIAVELQHFAPEFRDESGRDYFRAPDHFAPRILTIKGFAIADPPEGAPEDLPRADPLRDGAISELTRFSESQKIEIQNLRSDLSVAAAKIMAFSNEKANFLQQIEEKDALIESLREQLEDKGVVEVPTKKVK